MILFHGTDARAASFIEKEGLRGGSSVTDSLASAQHYARRSAGAVGSLRGAVVVLEVLPYQLRGAGLDPDNILAGGTWRLACAVRPIEILAVRCPRPSPEERIWHEEVAQHRHRGLVGHSGRLDGVSRASQGRSGASQDAGVRQPQGTGRSRTDLASSLLAVPISVPIWRKTLIE